jgi:hypothetical protein
MNAAERLGAPVQIRLTQLSVFNQPPRPGVMAVFKGYFDDSQTADHIWAVAGYVGADHRWEAFEDRWQKALDKHGVPYFHMREMADPNGVYKKWQPPQGHEKERAAFFSDLTSVLRYCRLQAFASIVRMSDLARFNAEFGLTLEPYPLAAFGCMVVLSNEHDDTPSQLFFDHVEKIESKLQKTAAYADSDRIYASDFKQMVRTGLPEGCNFKKIRALQAADFAVWELRKHHLQLSEWFGIDGKPINSDERWTHFQEWSVSKFGQPRPTMRKSAEALLKNGISNLVWDYDQLRLAHNLRGGVWA